MRDDDSICNRIEVDTIRDFGAALGFFKPSVEALSVLALSVLGRLRSFGVLTSAR